MRVLMVGGSHSNPGGVEAFCERAAQALGRRGDWQTTRISTETAHLRPATLRSFFRGLTRLTAHLRREYDCVWLQYVNLPDLAYLLLAKLFGAKVMVTPHLGSNWRSQRNKALRSLSERMLRLADRMALISRTQESEIALPARVPRSDIRNFLPEALLDSPLADHRDTQELRLLHSGRLSEGKGTFDLIEVCAIMRDQGVAFSLTITGGAEEATYARLNELIAQHALGEYVTVTGRIDEADLLDFMRSADVLVHLSRIDSYPLVVLECLALSTFPVCMELAGARDMVERYAGHIVPVNDAIGVTAEYMTGVEPRDIRDQARRGALGVRRDYSWSTCGALLEGALLDTIDARVTDPALGQARDFR